MCDSPAVWGGLLLSLHNLVSVASPKLLLSVILHLAPVLPGLPKPAAIRAPVLEHADKHMAAVQGLPPLFSLVIAVWKHKY